MRHEEVELVVGDTPEEVEEGLKRLAEEREALLKDARKDTNQPK